MRDRIILFSHNIHAFMFNEIQFASQEYEKVVLIAPQDRELQAVCDRYANVVYESFIPFRRLKELAGSFFQLDRRIMKDIYHAAVNKVATVDYLKNMMYFMRYKSVLNRVCRKYIDDQGNRWVIVSFWLFATAYAVSLIKDTYKDAAIVSLAHAFEIDDSRNQQIDYSCKEFCHERLDYISFISKNRMNEYLKNHADKWKWRVDNCHVDYLGTVKENQTVSSPSDGNPYHIVTCSRCIELKRLDLLIRALSLINETNIHWTHIGDGVLFNDLREMSKYLPSNITVSWLGSLPNSEVHAFYANHAIDLAMNLSTTEGIPVSLIEALSYGIPIIATDVGGNSEVCDSHVGFLLSLDPSPEEVKNAIELFLSFEKGKRNEIRNNALIKYEKSFSSNINRPVFYQKISMIEYK